MYLWDEAKNASNRIKHGLSFENAVRVFDDPFHLTQKDQVVDGEMRWLTLGLVEGVAVLFVAHTIEEDATTIRIISARKATKQERRIYEEG